MGGVNYSDGSLIYLNVSAGKLVNKKQEKKYDAYEGMVQSIAIEDDEYEGKPLKRVRLILHDAEKGEKGSIAFLFDSWCSQNFFARAEKIDLSKPLLFGVLPPKDRPESKASFSYLKQDGKVLEKDPDFPRAKKVTISGKEFSDWGDMMAAATKIVEKMQDAIRAGANMPNLIPDKHDDLPF